MTVEMIDAVLNLVFEDEGGLANHPDDKGGLTHFGLTKPFLHEVTGRIWSDEEVRQLSLNGARSIFKLWMQMRRLDQLPEDFRLAWFVVDFAVHSGARTAIRAVQRSIGAVADGIAGAETQGLWHLLDEDDRRRVACEVLAARIELVGAWITNNPSQAVFAKGVSKRLGRQVRACA